MVSNSNSSTHRGRSPKMKQLIIMESLIICNNNTEKHKIVSQIDNTFTYRNLHITINRHVVYQNATNKKMKIRKFRELLIREWFYLKNDRSTMGRRKQESISPFVKIHRAKL